MNDSIDIKQRILEMILVLDEYTPKLESVNHSLNQFSDLIHEQQKYQNDNSKSQASWLDNLKSSITELINQTTTSTLRIKQKSFSILAFVFLLISFVCGFFLSFHFSEKIFFSNHRINIINELESENLQIRKQYLNDIKLIETLRGKGCVISSEMLLAPKSIINNSGNSNDGKFQGVWLKDLIN